MAKLMWVGVSWGVFGARNGGPSILPEIGIPPFVWFCVQSPFLAEPTTPTKLVRVAVRAVCGALSSPFWRLPSRL